MNPVLKGFLTVLGVFVFIFGQALIYLPSINGTIIGVSLILPVMLGLVVWYHAAHKKG